jgi:hypothetical protein
MNLNISNSNSPCATMISVHFKSWQNFRVCKIDRSTHSFPLVLSRHSTVGSMSKHIHHLRDRASATATLRACTRSSLCMATWRFNMVVMRWCVRRWFIGWRRWHIKRMLQDKILIFYYAMFSITAVLKTESMKYNIICLGCNLAK